MRNNKTVFISILAAALIISGALFFTMSGRHGVRGEAAVAGADGVYENVADNIRPVGADDYVRGSTSPEIVIVEYSDLECPFCKTFHATLQRIVRDYGDRVAWVYREFPIMQLHSQAGTEALASECVGKLGGNDAFWKFIDEIYATTPSNNGFNLSLLPAYAERAGASADDFAACMKNSDAEAEIRKDLADAANLKRWAERYGNVDIGTPFSVVVAGKKSTVIAGMQSYEEVKALIDGLPGR